MFVSAKTSKYLDTISSMALPTHEHAHLSSAFHVLPGIDWQASFTFCNTEGHNSSQISASSTAPRRMTLTMILLYQWKFLLIHVLELIHDYNKIRFKYRRRALQIWRRDSTQMILEIDKALSPVEYLIIRLTRLKGLLTAIWSGLIK